MYKLLKHGVQRLSDGAVIPPDPANTDCMEFLKWRAAGNIPEPVDPPSSAELNAPILAALAANDAKIIRALAEGDAARIAAHIATQAALRAQLK